MESPPSSPRSNAQNAKKSTEVPLLNEINSLIEKERILLELKLLDKNLEAEEWKAKYESLKQRLCEEEGEEDGDVKKLLAMEETEEYDAKVLQTATMREVMATRIKGNLADLSFLEFTPVSFGSISKALFGVRSTYPDLRIASVKGCNLSHANAAAIAHLMRSPQLDGVDLSSNSLDDVSFIGIVEMLKNRKNTPQYLLFDKNAVGGHAGTLFCTMLHYLSENTWGLSVSLPDTTALPGEVSERNARKKANRPQSQPTVGDNNAYKDLVRHPYASAQFLHTLHDVLFARKESMGLPTPGTPGAGTGRGRGKVQGRVQRGLQSLHTLALTQHSLSRKSVVALEKVTHLLRDSLTDLDLSFSYIGPSAVYALTPLLRHADCVLVRLGLRGNLLGDQAASQILQALPANSSLTWLDLAHNALTSQLSLSLCSVLPLPLLHCLDLRGNELCVHLPAQVHDVLSQHGACGKVLFDDFSHLREEVASFLDRPHSLFLRPTTEQRLCHVGTRCVIQALDLAKFRANTSHPSLSSPPADLSRQCIRLVCQLRPQAAAHSSDMRVLHALGERLRLQCEVVVHHREERRILSCLPLRTLGALRDGFPPARQVQWQEWSVLLPPLPEAGSLRIDVVCSALPSLAGGVFVVESRLLTVTAVDLSVSSPWQVVGGDPAHSLVESLVAVQQDLLGQDLARNEAVLRAMRYPCSGRRAKATFSAKLVAPEAGEAALGAAKAKALRYDILVYHLSEQGTRLVCTLPYQSDSGTTSADAMLGAWKPKAFVVELSGLRMGDRVIVTGKVGNNGGGGAESLIGKGKVKVQAMDFRLWTYTGDLAQGAVLPSVDQLSQRIPYFSDPSDIYSF